MASKEEMNQKLQKKLRFSAKDLAANSRGKLSPTQQRLAESLFDLNPGQPEPVPRVQSIVGKVKVRKHFRIHGGRPGHDAICHGKRIAIVRGGRSVFQDEVDYRLYFAEFGAGSSSWALLLSAEVVP